MARLASPTCLLSRRALLCIGLASLAASAPRAANAAEVRSVAIAYWGPLPSEDALALARRALSAFYGFVTQDLPRAGLPAAAFYAPRRRYRAEKLLAALARGRPSGAHRILGVTGADVSTTKAPYADWGILGLGDLDGAACVVSSFRCRRGATDGTHVSERFAKVVVHELGHTLGLPHCDHAADCLMRDGGGSVLTVDTERDLCAHCRGVLSARGYETGAGTQLFR